MAEDKEHGDVSIKEYPEEQLNAQPLGYWSGEGYRRVVGRIRADLAVEGLTQPHWWTLNHVAGAPGLWSRSTLTAKLRPFDDLGIDLDDVFLDLIDRGWLKEDGGTLTLTETGEAGRRRAWDRSAQAQEVMRDGITTADYVTTINVLRRVIGNLGGESDLPG
ncbi:MarR family transcriptional regulator [Sphaerisporangium sp. B11E5]|uniref:MarR family transcriptional regulator n=1 Tax=Sphaerisporangium sp. B11E5 TaxID=3153563 RepID=UPI00325F7E4E